MKSYSYPRVVTSVTALKRSNARPAAEDTVIYFTPIVSATGPAGELVKIHSLEEFRSIFGIDKRLGLTLLNISNWLTAGGTLYTCRLVNSESAKCAGATLFGNPTEVGAEDIELFKVESKYYGSALNGYTLKVILLDSKKGIQYILYNTDKVVVERNTLSFKNSLPEETFNIENISEYLKVIKITKEFNGNNVSKLKESDQSSVEKIEVELEFGNDGYGTFETALSSFWENPSIVKNRLETPIDVIMDAGYPLNIKKLMIAFISKEDSSGTGDVSAARPDINGYFDLDNLDSTELTSKDEESIKSALFDNSNCYKKTSNVFFFDQKITISEEAYFDKDMTVYPSYFLSSLVPSVELTEGIQFPVAGTRRGELTGVKKLSKNPDPDEKESLFKNRINYIEKDSRGYYFMSQRVFDGSSDEAYTALSFINNARVTCRMVHDLERLGRDYLFEFNDAITLANMSSVMNRYVSNWIANRTLSFGNVVVSADPYTDEKVNAVLNIKFTNTIEVISIDLILQ